MKKISDEKKCVICLTLVIVMGFLLFYTYAGESENSHEGIIRLHVIANSNKLGDQALKLKVRDAVIEYMGKQDDLTDIDDTRKYLKDNTDRLEKIAEGVIASEGYDYPAGVNLGVRYIPEKTYGDITFPAGNYEALNITIGSGEGENWWCVLFPPLCLLDEGTKPSDPDAKPGDQSSDQIDAAPGGQTATDNGSTDALTQEQQLQLRWKILELLEKDMN